MTCDEQNYLGWRLVRLETPKSFMILAIKSFQYDQISCYY